MNVCMSESPSPGGLAAWQQSQPERGGPGAVEAMVPTIQVTVLWAASPYNRRRLHGYRDNSKVVLKTT
jgi:hypothetical protein